MYNKSEAVKRLSGAIEGLKEALYSLEHAKKDVLKDDVEQLEEIWGGDYDGYAQSVIDHVMEGLG